MHPKALGKEKQTTPKKSRWEEIFKIRDDENNLKKTGKIQIINSMRS